ncbi:MAG: glycosyltransferase [Gemmobacter sp.]
MIRDYMRRVRNALPEGAAQTLTGLVATPVGAPDKSVGVALRYNGLFDPAWYLAQNVDVAAAKIDPLTHYMSSGMAELRDPSPLFSMRYYLETNKDVAMAGVNPLAHFIASGGPENRRPHPLVAPQWLRGVLKGPLPFDNPLLGLLMSREPVGPRPFFDMAYLARGLGLPADAPVDAVLGAWFLRPPAARPAPHPLFDVAWAHEMAGLAPNHCVVEQYCADPDQTMQVHPLFDSRYAVERWPGHAEKSHEMTVLDQALLTATPERALTSPLVDPVHYLRQLGPEGTGGVPCAQHYLTTGAAAGIDPNRWFDTALYRARYGHVMGDLTPLEHYMRWGREVWVTLAPRFPDRFYVTRHPEVAADYPGPPLLHYLAYGQYENRRLREPVWADDFESWDEVRAEVAARAGELGAEEPQVSVIVPVYNQFLYTLRCLWSILRAGDGARLQVIIADDGSDDETQGFFGALPGVTYIRNPQNMGFLRSCNNAATRADAPYLFFLNNDTAVLPGWIDRLLDVARAAPEAGLVGSKLVYPDGTLQEAGGFVWADGGGANLGRNADPQDPGFNLRRDADYISGAAILVPAAVWRDVGGFDEHYAPAYCEDTDLAMRLRNLGWRVIYQPASVIVHFEGVSSGTSTDSGIKAYQVVNFEKLRKRWDFALENHQTSQTIHPRTIPRTRRPRILMIDHMVPEPDKDAGSVIAWWHVKLLVELGYEVTFAPHNLLLGGHYGTDLQAQGAEVIHAPYVRDLSVYLRARAGDFDLFMLCRFAEGGLYIDMLRQLHPETPVIFLPADLHFLRAEREARLKGASPGDMEKVGQIRHRELEVIGLATETALVSTYELSYLRAEGIRDSFTVLPLVMPTLADVPPRAGRTGIAFVGGYQHKPNVDAVFHFLKTIWPLLHARMPELVFHIVGSKPPPEILALDLPNVRVEGFVPDLDGFLSARIATVVPLQYGAGIKGKIGSSLAAGVPVVSTGVGAEGMGLKDGSEVLIADAAPDFAAAVERLCDDAELWADLSQAGLAFVRREYSPATTKKRLLRLVAKAGAAPFSGRCALTGVAENRRFLHDDQPDSLSRAPEAPGSAERVLASALARMAGLREGMALDRMADGALPGVAVPGDMAGLTAVLTARGCLAAPATAGIAALRLALDDAASAALMAALDGLGSGVTRLLVACPPVGMAPGTARADPARLAALVRQLQAAGWEVRTSRMPLPESALTGCALIEGRRARVAP